MDKITNDHLFMAGGGLSALSSAGMILKPARTMVSVGSCARRAAPDGAFLRLDRRAGRQGVDSPRGSGRSSSQHLAGVFFARPPPTPPPGQPAPSRRPSPPRLSLYTSYHPRFARHCPQNPREIKKLNHPAPSLPLTAQRINSSHKLTNSDPSTHRTPPPTHRKSSRAARARTTATRAPPALPASASA